MKIHMNEKRLVKNIINLSFIVRKLSLYVNFISSSKPLNKVYIKKEVEKIKFYIENIENNL